jgi:hypothetical protein
MKQEKRMEALNELHEKVNTVRRRAHERLPKPLDREVMSFNCNILIELRDAKTGEIKDTRHVHNLIVTAGKNLLLAVDGTAKYVKNFDRIAIGTGTTDPAISDTALQTEVARSSQKTPTNPSASVYQVQHTFPAGTGTGAITEVGLFDANSSGNMLNRSEFAAVNKAAGDELTMTVQIS